MEKEFKLKTNYFDGRKISDYGIKNRRLDYGTLAKLFQHVLCNNIIECTYGVGFWELISGEIFYEDEDGEQKENEIMQFQSIILMLMYIDRIDVQTILEWLSRFSYAFKEPIETIKEIVDDDKNQFYKTAIFIVGVWVAIILIKQILNVLMYEYYTFSLLGTIKSVISPILKVLVMAIIIHLLNKENKQPLTKSITAVAVAKIPLVISACLGFLTFISSRMTLIVNPISSLLSVISIVLMYFVIKEMFKEKEDSIKAFIKVEAIYYIVAFVFSFLGISL